jgi:hypothetical protein
MHSPPQPVRTPSPAAGIIASSVENIRAAKPKKRCTNSEEPEPMKIKRPNKVAQGFTDHEERRKAMGRSRIQNPMHPQYNHELGKLTVWGTTDELAKGVNYMVRKVVKSHPTDMGYFKQMYVLSDFGKTKLKRMRCDAVKKTESGTINPKPKIP